MRKHLGNVLLFVTLLVMTSYCVSYRWSVNPEMRSAPRHPSQVALYDRILPSWPFVVMGRIEVDGTWMKGAMKKVQKVAAKHGADAVIFTEVLIDTVAYNRGVVTRGVVTQSGDNFYFYAVSQPSVMVVKTPIYYGYMVKRHL